MKILKIIALTLAVFSAAACSTNHSNYEKIVDVQDGKIINASYIQWNKNYAVTAKHNLYPKNPDYVSDTLDLAFFKHPADKKFDASIVWRNPSIDEELTHVGSSQNQVTLSRNGQFINQPILYNGGEYAVSSATTFKGMSGGPVYSNDKQSILGMSVANGKNANINGVNYPNIALFIQTDSIEKEWEKFQNLK